MASDTATNAARQAADILRPHAADQAIADIIASLSSVGEGEGEDAGLEKAMRQISVARYRYGLSKADGVSATEMYEVNQRLDRAESALQREYLTRHSVGFAKAEASNAEAERLSRANFGEAA
jgi:hypothetical protein